MDFAAGVRQVGDGVVVEDARVGLRAALAAAVTRRVVRATCGLETGTASVEALPQTALAVAVRRECRPCGGLQLVDGTAQGHSGRSRRSAGSRQAF